MMASLSEIAGVAIGVVNSDAAQSAETKPAFDEAVTCDARARAPA
jgi:hypothetical protein